MDTADTAATSSSPQGPPVSHAPGSQASDTTAEHATPRGPPKAMAPGMSASETQNAADDGAAKPNSGWECPKCGEHNKDTRDRCNNCGWVKRSKSVCEIVSSDDEPQKPTPKAPPAAAKPAAATPQAKPM